MRVPKRIVSPQVLKAMGQRSREILAVLPFCARELTIEKCLDYSAWTVMASVEP